MKDLFTQFSEGRLSPHERQTRAVEGIWKALDGIDRSLRRIATKNIDELIANDVGDAINDSITKSMVKDLLLPYPEKWSDERKQSVRKRYATRPKNYPFNEDKEMISWLVYNWNLYCDEYAKLKRGERKRKPKTQDLMHAIGSEVKNDCQTKRLFVHKTGLVTTEQYALKQKIETK